MEHMTAHKSSTTLTSLDNDIPDIRYIEKEVVKLDPRGLVKNDIEFIRSKLQAVEWKPNMTMAEIAYLQGKHDLLKFIETKVVGRRLG